jgi:hypothetical protein
MLRFGASRKQTEGTHPMGEVTLFAKVLYFAMIVFMAISSLLILI